jgi:hypothetical protein
MDVWSQDRADHKNRIKRLNGTKGTANNATVDIRELKGNLRFPLDFTYHGCPRLIGITMMGDTHESQVNYRRQGQPP